MQVRKLIRLLKEAQEKYGPYAEVVIDTRRYKDWNMDWTHDRVLQVNLTTMEFTNSDGEFPENCKHRKTIVLNSLLGE